MVSRRGRNLGLDRQGLGQGRAGQSGQTGPELPDLCHHRPRKPSPPPSLPGWAGRPQTSFARPWAALAAESEHGGRRGQRGQGLWSCCLRGGPGTEPTQDPTRVVQKPAGSCSGPKRPQQPLGEPTVVFFFFLGGGGGMAYDGVPSLQGPQPGHSMRGSHPGPHGSAAHQDSNPISWAQRQRSHQEEVGWGGRAGHPPVTPPARSKAELPCGTKRHRCTQRSRSLGRGGSEVGPSLSLISATGGD